MEVPRETRLEKIRRLTQVSSKQDSWRENGVVKENEFGGAFWVSAATGKINVVALGGGSEMS